MKQIRRAFIQHIAEADDTTVRDISLSELAFYAGAVAVLIEIRRLRDDTTMNHSAKLEALEEMHNEILAFRDERLGVVLATVDAPDLKN